MLRARHPLRARAGPYRGLRRAFAGRELAPGADVTSSADLRAFIRKAAEHRRGIPQARAGMGTDPGAVVDPARGCVAWTACASRTRRSCRGSSIGNPNAAIMMIAEKAADLIRGIPAPVPAHTHRTVAARSESAVIHQFIFAYPRPGMTEAEFQRYWVEGHAVNYASKIPQIPQVPRGYPHRPSRRDGRPALVRVRRDPGRPTRRSSWSHSRRRSSSRAPDRTNPRGPPSGGRWSWTRRRIPSSTGRTRAQHDGQAARSSPSAGRGCRSTCSAPTSRAAMRRS